MKLLAVHQNISTELQYRACIPALQFARQINAQVACVPRRVSDDHAAGQISLFQSTFGHIAGRLIE